MLTLLSLHFNDNRMVGLPPQAYYILSRAPYEVRGNIKKFGVTKLLDGGVYKAAYPLHDVSGDKEWGGTSN